MVTIKDVARETNLAISTISKFINGGKVRDGNEKVIMEAIEKLGFQPNRAARGLRRARTYTIGLILKDMQNQYFAKIRAGIEEHLREQGYSMIVCCHQDQPALARESVEFMAGRQVDGILFVPIDGCQAFPQDVFPQKIPIVALDRTPRETVCDSVCSNAAAGAYQAVEYLIQKGHERIGIITGTLPGTAGLITAEERHRGYLRALEDYFVSQVPAYTSAGDFSFDSGYGCMEKLWACPVRPTAVFISNYNMTLGAMTYLRNLKIAVPGELSIVAFDDLEFCQICRPKLTSVRQPTEDIAKESVKLLIRRIEGDDSGFPIKMKLPTTFIERDSVLKQM